MASNDYQHSDVQLLCKKALQICMFVLISICCLSYSLNASADPHLERVAEEFHNQFNSYLTDEDIPGGAFAIVSKDQFEKIGTFGYRDLADQKKHPIDENTVFRIASLSKTFAAMLTGILVQEKKLSWDDYIVKYSRVLGRKGQKRHIKIKHLLGQASGFQPYAYDLQVEDGRSLPQILRSISRLPLKCKPGRCYSYQNTAFSAIEPILESATDETYESLLQKKIFDPLGMENSSVTFSALTSNPNHAEPHTWKKGKPVRTVNKPNYYQVKPAAGVNASISDMAKYLRAQLGMEPELLYPSTLKTMTKPRVETKRRLRHTNWRGFISKAHYGIGWRNYHFLGNELIYHGGWISGYRSDIAYSPKYGVGIVILLNTEGRHTSYLTTQFLQKFFTTFRVAKATK